MDHNVSVGGMYSDSGEEKEVAFEPSGRLRSNTWPASRFAGQSESQSINEEDGSQSLTPDGALDSGRSSRHDDTGPMGMSVTLGDGGISHDGAPLTFGPAGVGQAKKNSSRRNAWGNMSYADLITQAIDSSMEKRLTLSQIYDWMVQNVPYFKDKGDSNSSAGWKNSIRHNLSLHNRFKREQNEGTGKSSWWTINPDAKPGKSTRRRAASMETQKYEKRRGRVRKQLEERRRLGSDVGHRSPSSPINEVGEYPPPSHSPLHNPLLQSLQEPFRSRTNSNASSYGRLSPNPAATFDDPSTPALSPHPWTHESSAYGGAREGDDEFQPQIAGLDVQLTQSMQLHESGGHSLEKSASDSNSGPTGRNGPFFQNATGYHWNKQGGGGGGGASFLNSAAASQSNQMLSKMDPRPFPHHQALQQSTVMNAHIFSGGSFSSIPDDKARTRLAVPEMSSPVESHQRLPSISRSQFSDSDLQRQLHQQQQSLRSSLIRPPTSLSSGSFPADLDLFMDTVQPGFAGVDVDAVFNYEMTVGGNLLDVNFDSCLNGSHHHSAGNTDTESVSSTPSSATQTTTNLHPWL